MRILMIIIGLASWLLGEVDAEITLSKKTGSASKVAIVDCSNNSDVANQNKVFNIFKSDFKLSNTFNPDSKHSTGDFASNAISSEQKNIPYLFKYKLSKASNGIELKVVLQETSDGKILFSKNYGLGNAEQYPFLLHKSVSDIGKATGSGNGNWLNRFVIISKASASGKSQIILSDYTMTYSKTILSGGLNIFPKWANSSQNKFYITDMNGAVPTLYLIDMNSGEKRAITKSEGMLVCSDVSKNGGKILVTMAPNGQPDVYELQTGDNRTTKITDYSGIDVSGKYGANDSEVMFVSNRSGKANIYKKSLNSPSISTVTNHGAYNNTFDYIGHKVVFSSKESQGVYNIYMQSDKNSRPTPLTTSGDNQYPKFLSDGNIVAFVKQQGNKSKIGYINTVNFKTELFDFNGKIQSLDW